MQRIEALDVVRGFALLGIFMMNIEFFNRPFTSFNEGMPRGLTGADWWASWFVNYFVQGKFWTIFSLLFGMGFAVMMVRAEQSGREFKRVYLRRVLALAVFGAAHFIFLWDGDILFTYAVAALMLMVVLYGRPKPLLLSIVVIAGLGAIPDMDNLLAVAAGLAVAGLLALYLRNERRLLWFGRLIGDKTGVPIFCALLLGIGLGLCVAAGVMWAMPDAPVRVRRLLSVFGPLVLLMGWLSYKYHDPVEKRPLRLAVSLYLFLAVVMTSSGVLQRFMPDTDAPLLAAAAAAAAASQGSAPAAASPGAAAAAAPPGSAAAAASPDSADGPANAKAALADDKPRKTPTEKAQERKAEREESLAERQKDKAEELRVLTQGSYAQAVDWRARMFLEKAAGDFASALLFLGMFMLGMWFVRSGVMEKTADHLLLFRKLALVGLPIGIAIGLAGSAIAMSHTPGDRYDGWGIARGLLMLGNLPACLGYVGLVVLMLHSRGLLAHIKVLAPMGRMALTNYLLQSLICAIYFHGYALGHWGMPRAQQLLFVVLVYAAQLAFSHWWLARFRYGPMEWLWRGFTYRQTPKFRVS